MRPFTSFLIALSLASPMCCAANTAAKSESFTERTPAYFVDRYGSGSASKMVYKHGFLQLKRGGVEIEGQFSVREFRSEDLRVHAVFNVPSLKLAAVRLQLPRQWTPEQIDAALKAYGSGWKEVSAGYGSREWVTPDGLKAIYLLTFLEIQSPDIVKAVEDEIVRTDAKRKEVPKF